MTAKTAATASTKAEAPVRKAVKASTEQDSAPQVTGPLPPPPRLPSGTAEVRVVVKNEKPPQPLSPTERRGRSVENMEKIGRALAAYVAKYGRLPPQALVARDGRKTLSWRVAILPELGYPQLYDQFNPNEAWDSARHKELLAQIPPEYQSPERFNTTTNYVAAAERGMAFDSLEGWTPAAVRDGLENTLAILEADDGQARPWTQPLDFVPNAEEPLNGLGGVQADGTFAIMASGRVVLIPRGTPESLWMALFSCWGGEHVNANAVLRVPVIESVAALVPSPPTPPMPPPIDSEDVPPPVGAVKPPPFGPAKPVAANTPAVAAQATAAQATVDLSGLVTKLIDRQTAARSGEGNSDKAPIPDEEVLKTAREQLRDLYTKKAKPHEIWQRQQLVKQLLTDASKIDRESADCYEMLRVARDEAAKLGDVKSALTACELIDVRFRGDSMKLHLKALQSLCDAAKLVEPVDDAFKEAYQLTRAAFDADRYDVALPAQRALLEFGRIAASRAKPANPKVVNFRKSPKWLTPDTPEEKQRKAELARIERLGEMLEAAESFYDTEKEALNRLRDHPDDPAACETVGRYLCFVKNEWEDGLPFLAKAADIKLRVLASIDLTAGRSAQESLTLGDEYWELATKAKPPQQRGLHLRAAWCYGKALENGADNLAKMKAQKRIDESAALYGRDELDRIVPKSRTAATPAG